MSKKVDDTVLTALEQERNEALERVVKRVKESKDIQKGEAYHSSHSSSGARTHQSIVSAQKVWIPVVSNGEAILVAICLQPNPERPGKKLEDFLVDRDAVNALFDAYAAF